jgi:cytoskeletal protein RodZ
MLSAETARKNLQAERDEQAQTAKPNTDIPPELVRKSRYSSSQFRIILIFLVLLGLVSGGLYLVNFNQETPPVSNTPKTAAPTATPATSAKIVKPPETSSLPAKKEVTSSAKPAPAVDSPLPSFVTVSGRDSKYPARAPGWERYVDKKRDVRVYRVAGKIKAVQVLAAKNQVVADSFMQTALREVAGSSAYKPISSERKDGFVIQRNSAGPKAKLTVYRIESSNKISAFVVNLEE